MTDSIALQKAKEYVNVRQWVKECKKRWAMPSKDAKVKWQELIGDPQIPKSKDQMGWITMPAIHVFSPWAESGCC